MEIKLLLGRLQQRPREHVDRELAHMRFPEEAHILFPCLFRPLLRVVVAPEQDPVRPRQSHLFSPPYLSPPGWEQDPYGCRNCASECSTAITKHVAGIPLSLSYPQLTVSFLFSNYSIFQCSKNCYNVRKTAILKTFHDLSVKSMLADRSALRALTIL